MSMPLVVLTYPGHFFFTKLTLTSFAKHHSGPDRTIIIADDLSPWTWSSYLQDCADYYKEFEVEILPTSDLVELKKFQDNGWLRQQMVKLYIDRFRAFDRCFFTDGDIMFLNTVDPDIVPYSKPNPDSKTQMINQYVTDMIGIENPGFQIHGQQICVSDPAFRSLNCQTISRLRSTVESRLGQDFAELHLPYQSKNTFSVSEWELIENFKHWHCGLDIPLMQYAPHDFTHTKYTLDFFSHQFVTCYCTDAGVGQSWFQQQGLDRLEHYWRHVEQIVK